MCGICGIMTLKNGLSPSLSELKLMGDALVHRGPDDEGVYTDSLFGGIHKRLSIVDVETGRQPLFNEDKSLTLLFNGEIYNFKELKKGLIEKGHIFYTKTDCEVILHLYEEKEFKLLDEINGMFAFVIWDKKRRVLFGARDRLGIKPLYYLFNKNRFYFSSEPKGINKVIKNSTSNPQAILDFINYDYCMGNYSFYKDVYRLMPGEAFTINNEGEFSTWKYWDIKLTKNKFNSIDEASERLEELLFKSVKARLMSDVPIGTYLSGGLDSAVIAGLIRKANKDDMEGFCAGFESEAYDERPFAEKVADKFNYGFNSVKVKEDELFQNLKKIIYFMDEPTISPGLYPYFFLCNLVSQKVKGVLGGQGSDEILGGYTRYRKFMGDEGLFSSINPIKAISGLISYANTFGKRSMVNSIFGGRSKKDILLRAVSLYNSGIKGIINNDYIKEANTNKGADYIWSIFEDAPGETSLQKIQYVDIKNMLSGILSVEDRMSMASSIESRVPFLDHNVVEFCYSLQDDYKVFGMEGKRILRVIANRLGVPPEIINRRKQGFAAPLPLWLMKYKEEVKRFILGGEGISLGIFSKRGLTRLFNRRQKSMLDFVGLWKIFVLEQWLRNLKGN